MRTTPDTVPENPRLYRNVWVTFTSLYVALLMVGGGTWTIEVGSFGKAVTVGSVLIYGAITHFVLSWRMVRNDEGGGIFLFGRPLREVSGGLHYVAWGVMHLSRVSIVVQQLQLPAAPEYIFEGDEHQPLPPGKVRAILLPTAPPSTSVTSTLEILNIQANLRVSFVVAFTISRPLTFLARIQTIENARQLLRDIGERCLGEELRRRNVGEIVTTLPEINASFLAAVTNQTTAASAFGWWGISIASAYMLPIALPHTLSREMFKIAERRAVVRQEEARVSETQATANQVRISSDAEEYKLTAEGRGRASARKAELLAEAEGLEAQKTTLEVSGDAVLATQATRDALKHADSIVVGGAQGMHDLVSTVKAAQQALDGGTRREKVNNPDSVPATNQKTDG